MTKRRLVQHPVRRSAVTVATSSFALVAMLAGCGGDATTKASPDAVSPSSVSSGAISKETTPIVGDPSAVEPASGSPSTAAGEELRLPSVQVVEVVSGNAVDLASFAPKGDKPLLVWAWAPH